MQNLKNIYFGIFLISLATLALEITLIRFFSISQWYHFAFMVVSIALFGIAASGTFLTIKKLKNPLFLSSILFSFSVIIGFFVTNNISFDPNKIIVKFSHIFVLFIYYIFLALPFFFFGIIIAYSFSKLQAQSGKVYFFNMSGSALGALASLFFISYFNVKTIFIISLIGLISSLFFIDNNSLFNKPLKKISLKKLKIKNFKSQKIKINSNKLIYFLIILNLLLFLIPVKLNISEYKELSQALNVPNSEHIDSSHNSFSQVDIFKSSFARYAPGLSPTFKGTLPEQIGITIDASNINSITKYENLNFIDNLPNSIPYFLIKNPKTLILNSGAGLDVLTAIKNNATTIAIESNPIVINLLKNKYSDYSGNIYNRADVLLGGERSFIKSREKFDVIVISLDGSVLSSSASISGLSENYLLTKEAFQGYYNSLNEDGILIITRWLLFPPRESLRLFSLALEIDNEANNIAMFRSWTTTTLLLSKKPLNKEKIQKIKEFTEKNKFDIIYLPANFKPNKNLKFKEPFYFNAVNNLLKNKNEFYKNYIFNVKPVTDNKPFYFNFFKISKFNELRKIIGSSWQPFLDSGFLLFFILIQALVLSLIFIILPINYFNTQKNSKGIFGAQKISLKFSRENKLNIKIKKKPLFYFFAIGISYLFIEIILIQKFVLFLGHIIFSSSTIIFSMLLFSSLGSLTSQKLNIKKINKIIFIIFILVIIYVFLLDFIISYFISLNLIPKLIITLITIAPLGFLMGFPFPIGIRTIKKELIPWSWAVNGSASVLSPILAVLIALYAGYNFVFLLAGFIYFVGLFFILPKPLQSKAQT